MKVIKFRPYLIPLVLSGEKNTTWRVNDDKDFQVGDEVSLVNWETLQEFSQGKVISVIEKKFKEVIEEDFIGHEKYKSPEDMYAEYRGYYGDFVGPETLVKMIRFTINSSI